MNEKSVELTKGGGNRYETKKKEKKNEKKKRDRNNGRSMDTFFEGESFLPFDQTGKTHEVIFTSSFIG